MAQTLRILNAEEVAVWSGSSILRDGHEAYEVKYGSHQSVTMQQVMLAQDGPTLEASSGSCLVIAIYNHRHKIGALVHINRDEKFDGESASLLEEPFKKTEFLADAPSVHFLTSPRLSRDYCEQMKSAKALIETLARKARFTLIQVTDEEDEIGATVCLNTAKSRLFVEDYFGPEQSFDLSNGTK